MLRFFEREKADVVLLYLNVIMVLPILFLEILYEENIIVDETFQDLVIFKYIIEKLTLIYFCNYMDKNKLKEVNKYAFLDINKDYYNKMEDIIKKELKEIEKESKYDDAIIANINYDKRQTNSTNYTYLLTYNNTSNTKTSTSAFNDNRYITVIDSKEDEIKGVDLKVHTEINKPNKDFVLNGQTKYDTRIEKQSLRTNITYTLYNTMGQENRGVHVDAYGTNKSRYVISVNNGKSWLTYNSSDNNWKEVQLSDVYDQGVTINDLASRTVMNALPTDYKSKIKIACAISSDAFNSTFHIHDLDIEFEDNNGPEATEIVNTTDHDYVYVKGVFVDKENDDVRYRVLSKNQVSPEYTQLYPNSDGAYLRAKNNEKFNFKFPLYKFSNGANYLKIETMDTRGVKSEKIINFTLIQGSPEVKIKSHNQFYADILMSHSMNRKFRFQIYINGTQKAPVKEGEWSEWLNPTDYKNNTFELNYTWNTNDVLIGLPNEIEIRVQDELKTITFTKFSIVGEYKSLLFKDENNFYYSTDTGDVLQTLDFGTVIGVYVDQSTGKEYPTTIGIINYSKDGTHVVPARPKGGK